MSQDLNQQENREVATAIAEIELANNQFQRVEDGGDVAVQAVQLTPEAIASVNEQRIAVYRQRARNERARGIKNLALRHDGVAALIEPVALNVPAVAAIFERWYSAMEFGLYVVNRRGSLVLGAARAEKLVEAIRNKMATLEEDAKTALGAVQAKMADVETNAAVENTEVLNPVFAKPAATHEVQMRTKDAKRLLEVFKRNDQVQTIAIKLQWNEALTDAQLDNINDTFRSGMRDLSTFLSKTLRGMKAKVSPLDEAPASPAAANDIPATEQAA